jgi:DNA mismatch repair protein MutS
MGQMGSFVPALEAEIGIADRIYCRVGAQDNLARGESTFLTEMNETAYILNTATEKSLVIMDEVGRGTGTDDGLSIAWAVCEELLNRIRCRTLFATHYHELALLDHPRLANRSMEVLDRDGEIVFLRKLKEGPALDSYGIHVARLAGLPVPVIDRAQVIMERFREQNKALRLGGGLHEDGGFQAPRTNTADPRAAGPQYADPQYAEYRRIGEEAARLDIDNISPRDALDLLYTWKRRVPPPGGPASGAPAPAPRKSRRASAELPPVGGTPFESGPSLFD